AAERLVARVHDAPTPLAGLEAWIDEILGFSFEVGKARRVAVLGTPGAMRADGYAEEAAHASQLMLAPLLEVLEAGRADGSFPSADPLRDAAMIRAMVWDAAGLPLARHRAASRDEA